MAQEEFVPSEQPTSFPTTLPISSEFTWRENSQSMGPWFSLTTDSSGKFVAGANGSSIYLSTDYGKTWIQSLSSPMYSMYSVAINSNGQYVFVGGCSGPLLYSNNSGGAWYQSSGSGPADNPFNNSCWNSIATDSSGQYVVAGQLANLPGGTELGLIYTSKDYGKSWESTSAPKNEWNGVTSDTTGQYLAAAASDGIYTSTNYGQTWIYQPGAPNNYQGQSNYWPYIAADSTGRYLAASSSYSKAVIYLSSNYGVNWTLSSAPIRSWSSLCSDSTGQYLVAGVYKGYIYASSDYGATWDRTTAPYGIWTPMACTPSLNRLYAKNANTTDWTGAPGYIYTGVPTSAPSVSPTHAPSFPPTEYIETGIPTFAPSISPSPIPSLTPTVKSTSNPSVMTTPSTTFSPSPNHTTISGINSSSMSNAGTSAGLIVGSVIGGLAAVIIAGFLYYYTAVLGHSWFSSQTPPMSKPEVSPTNNQETSNPMVELQTYGGNA
eukprot:gene15014-16723_t